MPDKYHLQNIRVSGFKSIKELNLGVENLNVLIGQNGAGKSNFISLFKFLRDIILERHQNTVLKSGGAESLLFYGSKETTQIEVFLDFTPNVYKVLLEPTDNDNLFISHEQVGFWKPQYYRPYMESIGSNIQTSNLRRTSKVDKKSEYVFDILKDWRVYHFHDTSESAGVKKYSNVADDRHLFEDAANLASFLYSLKQYFTDYYERIVKTIQLVIPFFNDFELQPSQSNSEIIRLEWSDVNSDKIFNANSLSDGSLRFICLATLLLQPRLPKLVLLDEPELGLHPSAISVLAGLLRKAATRSQVIVSTQSVNLVNEFDPEDIVVVDRNDDGSVFHRLDPQKFDQWLEEYSMGDLWEKNIIGGRP